MAVDRRRDRYKAQVCARRAIDFAAAQSSASSLSTLVAAALTCVRAGRRLERTLPWEAKTRAWARALAAASRRLSDLARAEGWPTDAVPQWSDVVGGVDDTVNELARDLEVL